MASGDLALRLVMTASAGQAISTITQLSTLFEKIGVGGGIALAAVAIDGLAVALGVTAVKAAGDFQSEMTRLVTSAGESQSALAGVSQGVLQLSVDTATSTDQLAQGMYYVESSGYHAAAGLEVLKAAAEGAKSENADLSVVAKALVTEMNDYHMGADQASTAMNGLIATVQNGTTNLQDLSSSMGNVLPIASSLGISFANVAGAMDTMTNDGMSARQASMNLAHVLLALSAPSKVAEQSMQGVGLSAQQVKDALVNQGLPEALQLIETAVGKKFPAGSVAYEQALKNILGGIVGVKLAAQLTGDNLQKTEDHIKAVAAAMNGHKGAVMGFSDVQQTMNFRLGQGKEMLHALLIQLGTALIPIIMRVISVVGDIAQKFLQWFIHSGILQTGLGILTTVIGKVIDFIQWLVGWIKQNQTAVTALEYIVVGLAAAFGIILAAGILLVMVGLAALAVVIGIITAVIMAVIWVVQNWGTIWTNVINWITGVWSAFSGWFMGILGTIGAFFVSIWDDVVNFFIGIWNHIVSFVQMVVGAIVGFFQGAWNKAVSIWNGLTTGIKNIITGAFTWVVNFIQGAINTVVGWFQWLYNHNYLFKNLVDIIRGLFFILKTEIGVIWQNITTFLTQVWQNIVVTAQNAWNWVKMHIIQPLQDAWNWIVGAWNATTAFLTQVWNNIVVTAQNAWNWVKQHIIQPLTDAWHTVQQIGGNIIGALQGAWSTVISNVKQAWDNFTSAIKNKVGAIASAVGNIVSSITGKISDLIGQALNWGKNLIQSLINGILSKLGDVKNAVGQIAGAIGSFLGFHSPTKEGPGREADTWMPSFIKMLVTGLNAGVIQVKTSATHVANALVNPQSFALNTGNPSTPQPQIAPVILDHKKIGEIYLTYTADRMRRQGGINSK